MIKVLLQYTWFWTSVSQLFIRTNFHFRTRRILLLTNSHTFRFWTYFCHKNKNTMTIFFDLQTRKNNFNKKFKWKPFLYKTFLDKEIYTIIHRHVYRGEGAWRILPSTDGLSFKKFKPVEKGRAISSKTTAQQIW